MLLTGFEPRTSVAISDCCATALKMTFLNMLFHMLHKQSNRKKLDWKLPLTGFEPRTSVERSDCCATVLRTVCIAPF